MDFKKVLSRFQKKEEAKEFFLSLIFKPFSVCAILFEKTGGRLAIVSYKERDVEGEVDSYSSEMLVEVCDKVITQVEQSLPPSVEVSKTIFAVPNNFVEEGKIGKEYLAKFKKVCEDLDLKPMGFIVTIEAIVHFLQKKEGVPITSIFVEITRESLVLYLVRAGNIVEVKEAQHSNQFAKTVELLLKSVHTFEVLPSKMVLLDYKGIDDIQQQFLSFPWARDLPFLHLPQVVTLEKGFENEAVVNGVAAQMGFEVPLKSHGALVDGASKVETAEEKGEAENLEKVDFGFLKEKDILEEERRALEIEKVSDLQEVEKEEVVATTSEAKKEMTSSDGIFQRIASYLSTHGSYRAFLVVGALVLFIGLFLYAYYNFFLRAEVILFLDKKVISKSNEVTLSAKEQTQASKNILKMELITIEKEETRTSDTTGKKEKGEKAKGEVTVYNKSEEKKTFDKGTIVVGPNKLEYEFSDSVNIASTSAFSTNFSNAKAKVVATTFGSEYNIPSSSNFTLKNVSSSVVFAKNDQAFSGGTKEEIQVVSSEDLASLEKELVEELKEKVISEIKDKASSSDILLPSVLTYEFTKKNFSKKAGEEAKKVTLSAKIVFKGGVYDEKEMLGFMKEVTKKEVLGTYDFVDSESKARLKDITVEKDGRVSAISEMRAIYVPSIDKEKILDSVVGKTREEVLKNTESIVHVTGSSVRFRNSLPFLPNFMPFSRSNITIVTNTNG